MRGKKSCRVREEKMLQQFQDSWMNSSWFDELQEQQQGKEANEAADEVAASTSSDVASAAYASITQFPVGAPGSEEARLVFLNELRYWVVLILFFALVCLVYGFLIATCQVIVHNYHVTQYILELFIYSHYTCFS